MDIVVRRKIQPVPVIEKKEIEVLEEAQTTPSYIYRSIVTLILVSLLSIIVPHEAYASEEAPKSPSMVFEATDHLQFFAELEESIEQASLQERHEVAVAKLKSQMKMTDALKNYLQQKRSPLADYADVILKQNNWKKIIALSNAESTMCRRYIEHLSNCWGVGGSDLWDMGDNLGEGVIEMNKFLNNSPRLSSIKYSQMNFEQMNGLYKQPPGDHWVYNNLEVYNELTALERSIK